MAGGQAFTSAAGNVGRAVTLALVGAAITLSAGTVTPNSNGTVPLTGQSIAITGVGPVGNALLTPTYSRAPTGSAATSAAGSVAPLLIPTPITGQGLTSAQGAATAQGAGASASLSGQEVETAQGDVDSGSQILDGGPPNVFESGIPEPGTTLPLTGIGATCQQGTTTPEQLADDTYILSGSGAVTGRMSVALLGAALTGSQGAFTVTGDASIALTGQASTAAAGTVVHVESFALGGAAAAFSQYSVGAPGGAALSGSSAAVIAGNVFITNDREFALVGQEFQAQDGGTFASSLAFPDGAELQSGLETIGPKTVELSGQAIDTSQGHVVAPSIGISGGGWPTRAEYAAAKKRRKVEREEKKPDLVSEARPVKEEREKSQSTPEKPAKQPAMDPQAVLAELRAIYAAEDEARQKQLADEADEEIALILSLAS